MATDNTTLLTAGATPGSRLAEIAEGRADILALTQATQEAVLNPQMPGGITSAERAALACRMARLNDAAPLAAHYEARVPETAVTITDPGFHGGADPRLSALIRHVDLVTQSPKNATRGDIDALRDAGIEEADIVRLSELIAFINYQIRVVAGLRLLGGIV